MLAKPTANSWSESNSTSLHQTQCGSVTSRMIDDARAVPAKATLSMERTLVSPVAGVVRATTKNHGNDAEHPHHANR